MPADWFDQPFWLLGTLHRWRVTQSHCLLSGGVNRRCVVADYEIGKLTPNWRRIHAAGHFQAKQLQTPPPGTPPSMSPKAFQNHLRFLRR